MSGIVRIGAHDSSTLFVFFVLGASVSLWFPRFPHVHRPERTQRKPICEVPVSKAPLPRPPGMYREQY
jgi:hypothetical protein